MRIAIVGAGSSRLPLMVGSLARSGVRAGLSEVVLFDIHPERIAALLPVARVVGETCGTLPALRVAGSLEETLEGVEVVLFTVRPGLEEARARDERACLDRGVLGQETTGAAGLAFATRSIPVLLECCKIARRRSPGFLPLVFTNPAGIATQALVEEGFLEAVGICDSSMVATRTIAERLRVPLDQMDFQVHGLNHLSWTTAIRLGDRDLLAEALEDEDLLRSLVPWDPELPRTLRRVPNEYLYYWYRHDEAVAAMRSEPLCRGEVLARENPRMIREVAQATSRGETTAAILAYTRWLWRRQGTYMSYARGPSPLPREPSTAAEAVQWLGTQMEGYAEVAMDLLLGRVGGLPRPMVVNVPNQGALPGFEAIDVVECDCAVTVDGIAPRARGPLPMEDLTWMTRVKEFERRTLRGIRERSRAILVEALIAHPLVARRELATELVGALEIPF